VQAFCDRATLIHDGEQRYLGELEEAALRYYRLNFAGQIAGEPDGDPGVKLIDVRLEDRDGRRLTDVAQGQAFRLRLVAVATRPLPAPAIAFELLNVDNVPVLGFGKALEDDDGVAQPLAAGERLTVSTEVDSQLVPGRYAFICSFSRSRARSDDALRDLRVLDFLVKGPDPMPGMISVRARVDARLERG
ncbi:MAG: Wzt carbohydrate-binding domain-containing protein, partial [Solirubrobacteraceae bacterium]